MKNIGVGGGGGGVKVSSSGMYQKAWKSSRRDEAIKQIYLE